MRRPRSRRPSGRCWLGALACGSVAAAFALGARAGGAEPPSYPADRAPARLAAAVGRADAAIGALQRALSARLLDELRRGGPARAVSVCRDEAPALAAETARSAGLRVGRTSHRLRNPGNAAPSWAVPFVTAGAGKKAAALEAVVVELPDRVGVLRPIATGGLCLQCHGPAESLSPEVRAFLETAYPEDRAVGFDEGDLRGFFWAEAPALEPASSSEARPETLAGSPERGRASLGPRPQP